MRGGELLARDAVGEAHVVLDPGARAGLAAGADRRRATPCRGPRTRRRPPPPARPARSRRRPGRTGTRAATRKVSPRCSANSPGVGRRRIAVGRDHDRRVAGRSAHAGEQHVDVVGVLEVDPLVGEAASGPRTPAAPCASRRVARADDPQRGVAAHRNAGGRVGRRSARKIRSARSGFELIRRRNSGGGIASTRPGSADPRGQEHAAGR